MSPEEQVDAEQEVQRAEGAAPPPKRYRALSRLRRELSEEELSSPGAVRLVLGDLDRAEEQLVELSGYRDRFYAAEKQEAILEERLKTKIAAEIIFGAALTVGAALIGLSPGLWGNGAYGPILVILGAVLILGGVASRLFIRL